MFDIVVVGSLNMDLVAKTDRLPMTGETVSGAQFFTVPGGKGANQAVAAGRLGAKIAMVGQVGNDAFAPQLLASLQESHVDITHVSTSDSPTGVALIEVDAAGNNRIVVAPGANHCVTPQHVDDAMGLIKQAKLVLIQLELPLETVQRAVQLADDAGVTVILDPAPARQLPREILSKVCLLTPNEHEAADLLRVESISHDRAREAAEALRKLGPKGVILKLGAGGAYLLADGYDLLIPSYRVQATDTTAAGDTFAGALGSALSRGIALPDAVRFAHAAAAISVTRLGAQSSMPWLEEVERFQLVN